jgi:hypothetical protein
MKQKFAVGDKVTKLNGTKSLTVLYVSGNNITAKYDHSSQTVYGYTDDFKPVKEQQTMTTKDAIYKLLQTPEQEEPVFANYRGTDSAGNWLMERIGNGGGIVIVSKDLCEEVLPYTFSVRMNGREQHFQGEAGKVKKGDILLYTAGGVDNFAFAVVRSTDTKMKNAKAWEGVRVLTEAI